MHSFFFIYSFIISHFFLLCRTAMHRFYMKHVPGFWHSTNMPFYENYQENALKKKKRSKRKRGSWSFNYERTSDERGGRKGERERQKCCCDVDMQAWYVIWFEGLANIWKVLTLHFPSRYETDWIFPMKLGLLRVLKRKKREEKKKKKEEEEDKGKRKKERFMHLW